MNRCCLSLWLSLSLTVGFLSSLIPPGSAAEPEPVRQEHRILTEDNIALGTDVWLPGTNGTYPTVLLRFPYDKNGATGLGRAGATRGFAVVTQDTRGRFTSGGENLPFHLDGPDGKATVAWIARQPWCNGRIGTWGASAGAVTQFQLAIGGTDALQAQFLVVGAPNLYDVVYTGGIFRKALIEDWLTGTRFATNALSIWVNHPTYDAYWQSRDASRHYATVETPAVHVGGYWDIFAQPTIDAFVGYQTQGGAGARGRQKLILGPWTHGVLRKEAGELTFPEGNTPPGRAQDSWLWFDHWLRDAPNKVDRDPAVTYYVIGDVSDPEAPGNHWRQAETWPPFETESTPYYFRSDHALTTDPPVEGTLAGYDYNPADPVPTVGGIQLTLPAGPMDQKLVESREDVLVFTSDPLTRPLEVTGRVRARLWITSDAPDTDFFVRLCDVYPDGRSFNLCEGMLRARFRNGYETETLLEPGQAYALNIDCWSTSVIFATGHRLRVQVTSSCAPGFDPNPNTAEPLRSSDRQRVAHNSVHLGGKRASHILLPVVSGALSAE